MAWAAKKKIGRIIKLMVPIRSPGFVFLQQPREICRPPLTEIESWGLNYGRWQRALSSLLCRQRIGRAVAALLFLLVFVAIQVRSGLHRSELRRFHTTSLTNSGRFLHFTSDITSVWVESFRICIPYAICWMHYNRTNYMELSPFWEVTS
jgi:hypothetical protein